MSEDYAWKAQQAAEAHLNRIWEIELDAQEADGVADWGDVDLAAPFCGCDTCIVREVLHAAWPILIQAARDEVTARPPQDLPVTSAPCTG